MAAFAATGRYVLGFLPGSHEKVPAPRDMEAADRLSSAQTVRIGFDGGPAVCARPGKIAQRPPIVDQRPAIQYQPRGPRAPIAHVAAVSSAKSRGGPAGSPHQATINAMAVNTQVYHNPA